MRNVIVILIASLGLCACADTAQFQQPITAFATASANASTAIAALDTQASAGLTAIGEKRALAARHVDARAQSCTLDSKDCVLVFDAQGDAVSTTTIIPKSVAFANSLKNYADALNALEKADSTADVQAAFGKGMSTMAALATAFGQPAGAALAALSTPLSGAVGWGFGQYQNQVKLDALQKATATADSIIKDVAPILEAEFDFGQVAKLQELKADLDAKEDAFDAKPTMDNLKAAIAAANLLDAAVRARPGAVVTALVKAHAALTTAVAHPEVGFATVAAEISAVTDQVQKLEQATKQLDKSAK